MKRLSRGSAIVLLCLAALLPAACDGPAATTEATVLVAPVPGTLEARLVTDATDIGAIMLRIERTRLGDSEAEAPVAAREGLQVFAVPTDDGWIVAVLGEDLRGALVRWNVPNVAAVDGYRATVLEAADEANEPRALEGTVAVGVR